MVVFFVVLVLAVVVGTVATTAILGRFWRFVLLRPAHRARGSVLSRLSLRGPGADEYAEQGAVRARLDAPFAAVFLGLSLIVLAMPGFAEAWVPLLALWTAAAVVRWRDTGPASSFVRLGTVILLALEALIVVGFRGGDALPQAGAYIALALVGLGILYRAGDLPLSFGPGDPNGRNLPPRRRAAGITKGAGQSLMDTLPAATRERPARRNSARPSYPEPTGHYGD